MAIHTLRARLAFGMAMVVDGVIVLRLQALAINPSAVGVRKPAPAIYRLACERLGVVPEAALFIDDHEGNVAGARAVGMRAVWCGLSAESTRSAAQELLALIGPG